MLLPLHLDALLRMGHADLAGDLLSRAPSGGDGRCYAAAAAAARFRLAPEPGGAEEAESAARSARWPWLAAVVGTWRGELLGEPEAAAGRLSERELEVARLVADGLSNPAIAARLYLSRATVASHVAHILTKLGFSARTQIASWVAGRGGAL